jgi:hypothetical protein
MSENRQMDPAPSEEVLQVVRESGDLRKKIREQYMGVEDPIARLQAIQMETWEYRTGGKVRLDPETGEPVIPYASQLLLDRADAIREAQKSKDIKKIARACGITDAAIHQHLTRADKERARLRTERREARLVALKATILDELQTMTAAEVSKKHNLPAGRIAQIAAAAATDAGEDQP